MGFQLVFIKAEEYILNVKEGNQKEEYILVRRVIKTQIIVSN